MSEQPNSSRPKHAAVTSDATQKNGSIAAATADAATAPQQKLKKPIFMYVIMFFLGFNIIVTLGMLAWISRDDIIYDFATLLDMFNLIMDGILFWLLIKRAHFARPFALCLTVANVLIGTVYHLSHGNYDIAHQLLTGVPDLVMFFYFLTSKKAKAYLNRDVSLERGASIGRPSPRTWAFWRNMVIYYCVFSVVGHWMELAFCWGISIGLFEGNPGFDNTSMWRDLLYPYPPEGAGFLVCAMVLYPIKTWLTKHIDKHAIVLSLSFVFNALACSLVEFACGLAFNANLQLWNYSDMPFNFMGQICLQNTLLFGIVSTIITWLVYPLIEKGVSRIPKQVMTILFVGLLVGYGILQTLYLINVPH